MAAMNLPIETPRNRLAATNSPYLLAHADNPVDWYPWGDAALSRAVTENKPILLSIGYATCHWCHVMEHESFRNSEIAAFMNGHFVCIKVDREERPDIDEVYMTATVALCGHGGWPMTVFLTPTREAFFAGTYFPPQDRHGHPGFLRVLQSIADLWNREPDRVLAEGASIRRQLQSMLAPQSAQAIPGSSVQTAILQFRGSFDAEWGGFDAAPKFPPHAALRLLFDTYRRDGLSDCLAMALDTLQRIEAGGIHDQIGGGFARYSTDERWQVPHFEKMLYDNAQLARAYLDAYRITGKQSLRETLEHLLDWVSRELTDASGGFYTGQDADSDGVEGRYYVFDWHDVRDALPEPEAEAFIAYYDVRPEGNWEGTNVLWTPHSKTKVAADLGIDREDLEQRLAAARDRISALRATRNKPLTDDKIIAGQTALMASAFAEAGRILHNRDYIQIAERAVLFVWHEMRNEHGRLLRCARRGKVSQPAQLDDYAHSAEGLLTLYETTGNAALLRAAESIAETMLSDFYDPDTRRVYHSPRGDDLLPIRVAEAHDGPMPNATAAAADVLARLSYHCDRSEWRERATELVNAHGRVAQRMPRGHADLLRVARSLDEPRTIIVLVPGTDREATAALRASCHAHCWPGHVFATLPELPRLADLELPLFQGRIRDDARPSVYVCRDDHCEAPVHDSDGLRSLLQPRTLEVHQDVAQTDT
jgi:uncharacterized protein YyaL (SSP411 family)